MNRARLTRQADTARRHADDFAADGEQIRATFLRRFADDCDHILTYGTGPGPVTDGGIPGQLTLMNDYGE